MLRGIITIATGKKEYIDMAINLGLSIKLNSPGVESAVITDSDSGLLRDLYTYIIKPEKTTDGFALKTSLHELSPFAETIFVDADSLFVSSAEKVFDVCSGHDFLINGGEIKEGYWFADISELLKKINREKLPKFNSGFIYFTKAQTASRIFSDAQKVFARQDFYGIENFKGSCPDEPCFAISMALNGISAYTDPDNCLSYTPISLEGKFDVNVFSGYAEWFVKGRGIVKPAVVHFVSRINQPEYRTECLKLRLHHAGGLIRTIMPAVASIYYQTVYLRRLAGRLYHKLF